jgi:hypothetical protein
MCVVAVAPSDSVYGDEMANLISLAYSTFGGDELPLLEHEGMRSKPALQDE